MLSAIFDQFVEASPISVMARGLMENIFAPEKMNKIFETHAQQQFQQELLFSSQVDLMSLVVCGMYPSVHAAYQAKAAAISVSTTTLYKKLQGIELSVSQALVRDTASQLQSLITEMGGFKLSPLPGYQCRIIDGSCIAGTDHRLKAISQYAAKPLPGKALVVLDPSSQLVIDVFPCEDGHAQERSLFDQVIATVQPEELWIGDRNFCTTKMLWEINQRQAWFVFRQHGTLGWTPITELVSVGMTATGEVFEQEVEITGTKQPLRLRRVVVKLLQPTRDKDWEIAILTNLSASQADAITIASLYRDRWGIETLFQTITKNFNGEIQTLAYPRAALFSLCMALVVSNILATLKAALGSVHGVEKIDAGLSDFYLVDEIGGTYRGMMIAIPPPAWQCFNDFALPDFVLLLQDLASKVHLIRFLKQPRKDKKPKPPLVKDPKHPHVSTAKLLSGR